MNLSLRLFAAALAAAIVPTFLTLIGSYILQVREPIATMDSAFMYALGGVTGWGIPLLMIARIFKLKHWRVGVTGGVLIGCVVASVFVPIGAEWPTWVRQEIIGAVLGASGGFSGWYVLQYAPSSRARSSNGANGTPATKDKTYRIGEIIPAIMVATATGATIISAEQFIWALNERETFGFAIFTSMAMWMIFFPLILLHVALLGTPAQIYLAKRFKLTNWLTCVTLGFFVSAIPIGLFHLPVTKENIYTFWNGQGIHNYVVHGVVTPSGWVHYALATASYGLVGAASGLAFWFVLRNKKSAT